tara:strand:- start:265 stop:1161 length:897 start_codon:yes stop_codon:yes gene_type:complete
MEKVIFWSEEFDPEKEAPCIVAGMPNEVYHATNAISKSGLDRIEKTPAHYKYGEFSESKAMEIGTALHAAILEPDVFKADFLMLPEIKDRRASEYKQAVKSHGKGNVLVGKECGQINGMVDAIRANYKAQKLLNSYEGFRELSFFAYDPVTGVLCRCRFDALVGDNGEYDAIDLKTTADAGDSGYLAFQNTIAARRYHVQDAFYSDVFEWVTGKKINKFWFIAVESKKPHGVICRHLDPDSIQVGRDEYRVNLDTYSQCLNTDSWPCYYQPESDEDCEISLPEWKWRQIENKTQNEIY